MSRIWKYTGLSKTDAANLAKQLTDLDDDASVKIILESDGTYSVQATYPDSSQSSPPLPDGSGGLAPGAPKQNPNQGSNAGAGPSGLTSSSGSLSDRVPIPPPDKFNLGLSACTEATMISKFGKPGALTKDCSQPTGDFQQRVRQNFDVGPFRVTGLDYAVESLLQLFSEVKQENQDLYNQIKNAGMLCVRGRRQNPTHYSNHSWGTAIDIFFGNAVVPQGLNLAHRGNLLLAPYFNKYGWYWGAGFSGDSVDSMHFELSEETILKIPDHVMSDTQQSAAARTLSSVVRVAAPYQPNAQAAQLLGSIVDKLKNAKAVQQQFKSNIAFIATLPAGQLYFDSELQLDTDGWPGGGDDGDADWQPETSLRYATSGSINANTVPFFVLPLPVSWPNNFGIGLGDIAAVIFKNKLTFAVFADRGPSDKLGEGSIELLRELGEERLTSSGRVINAGMGPGVITIVFPGSASGTPYQDEKTLISYIGSRGKSLFSELGGRLPSAPS